MKDIFFKTLMLKGEAGGTIRSIEKTATSGAVDTYTITLNDGSTFDFNVTNGSNIASIELTSTHDNIDTYTITLTNGDTTTFDVKNGNVVNTLEPSAGIDRTSNAPSVQAVNGGISAATTSANGYTDAAITSARTEWQGYTDGAINSARTEWQGYADNAETAAKNYADTKDAALRNNINSDYSDVSSFFTTAGQLLYSDTDMNFEAWGVAFWQKCGDMYKVKFTAKVTTAGTIANNYDYGLDVESLIGNYVTIETLSLVAQSGGIIKMYNANGELDATLNGYGAQLVYAGDKLVPARKLNADYNAPSSSTMWACAALPVGTVIEGEVFVVRGGAV